MLMKLTRHAVAQSLDLPLSTLDRWVRQGRIPIQRSGEEFEFRESSLRKWAASHHLPFKPPDTAEERFETLPLERLEPVMRRGGVFYELSGDSAAEVLASAVAVIPGIESADRADLLTRLMDRETLTSTGIGRGIAIPHPRTPLDSLVTPSITTCFLEKPVDFNAIDDRPVFVLFILLSTSVKVHLHLLSRLSFGVRSQALVEFLKQSPAPEALFGRVAEFEARLESGDSR
jgi:PTS system nitrogen regulatory IIA component